AMADRFEVSLVGGDTTRGPLSVSIQVLGIVPAGRALRRSGARPGDQIYVTGTLGCAAWALSEWRHRDKMPNDPCFERLLRPLPRVAIGLLLHDLATAAIDISDGLAADLGHI